MAIKNYLVEGVSGTGKTSVAGELTKRGYKVFDGDNKFAYQGDPDTGERTVGYSHEHHIWNIHKVRDAIKNNEDAIAFFCGGSRNFNKFIDLFDKVFVLDVDIKTLKQRLDSRAVDEWGGNESEKELIFRLHTTKEDIPKGIIVDATRPLKEVVDFIIMNTKN